MQAIHDLGNFGEDAAVSHLEGLGFLILNRNWRYAHLEIDIVCQQEDTIVFVEVKTRRSDVRGGPVCAITPQKIRNVSRAAQAWLEEKKAWLCPCRFDVICVTGKPGHFSLQHYPDAFPYVTSLDSRNSHWQY